VRIDVVTLVNLRRLKRWSQAIREAAHALFGGAVVASLISHNPAIIWGLWVAWFLCAVIRAAITRRYKKKMAGLSEKFVGEFGETSP